MSSAILNSLLREIVKNLLLLHNFQESQDHEYEVLARTTIHKLLELFGIENKLYEHLSFSVSDLQGDIRPAKFICYVSKTSNADDIDKTELYKYLKEYNPQEDFSRWSVLRNLIYALLEEKGPHKIESSYKLILLNLMSLVEFLIKLHEQSESQLIRYISHCFTYEWNFYTSLQRTLESGLELKEEDRHRMMLLLDSAVHEDVSYSKEHGGTSVFSSKSKSRIFPLKPKLGFHASNHIFNKLYFSFLHILSFKQPHETVMKKSAKIMLHSYKRHREVTDIELDSYTLKELKLNHFYDFLVGDLHNDGFILLPQAYEKINHKLLAEITLFPELDSVNYFKKGVDLSNQSLKIDPAENYLKTSVSKKNTSKNITEILGQEKGNNHYVFYSESERMKLIYNLRHIIPLLNEFDLNFSTDFPSIVKTYMTLVYSEIPEAAQNLDYRYINAIVDSINYIVDFENEDDSSKDENIKHIVLDLFHLHECLGSKLEFLPELSPLMRLSIVENLKEHEAKNQILKGWNIKTLQISGLDYNLRTKFIPYEEQLIKQMFLTKWYNRKLRLSHLYRESAFYYDKVISHKYLMVIWYVKLTKAFSRRKRAEVTFIANFFENWNLKLQHVTSMESEAIIIERHSLVSKYFRKYLLVFKDRVFAYDNFEGRVRRFLQSTADRHIQIIFSKWHQKLNKFNEFMNEEHLTLGQKISKLSEIQKSFILKKSMYKWKHSMILTRNANTLNQRSSENFLKFVFKNIWLKRTIHSVEAASFLAVKSKKLRNALFSQWRQFYELRHTTRNFSKQKVLHMYFNRWRLNFWLKTSKSRKILLAKSCSQRCLKVWKLKYKLSVFQRDVNMERLSIIFNKWVSYSRNSIDKMLLASNYRDTVLLTRTFKMISLNQIRGKEMEVKALVNFKRIYFRKLSKKALFYNTEMIRFFDLKIDKPSLNELLTKQIYFTLWQLKFDHKFELGSLAKVQYLNAKVLVPNIMCRHLDTWIRSYNESQANKVRLLESYDMKMKLHPIKVEIFKKWLQSVREKSKLPIEAEYFEKIVLLKKLLLIWYDQLLAKHEYLSGIANDYLDRRDFKKLSEILSGWSMKQIALTERNRQTCKLFVERWQNTRLKSILQLWMSKVEERHDKINNVDSQEDISTVSNQSPLAKKSTSKSISKSPHDNRSYIYTPLKSQVSGRFSRSPGWSPSKLQDTTKRLKNEKLVALRKHFGKARGSYNFSPNDASTPASFNGVPRSTSQIFGGGESKFIRLSPPPGRIFAAPPDRPNFSAEKEDGDSNTINNLSSIADTNSRQDDFFQSEASVVDNAKKFKKIVPIMFPTEEEVSIPIFSPLSKLKERMWRDDLATQTNDGEYF